MFEIGFSELLMLGLVSLLVIGPERLPKVARVAGFWVGRLQRTVANLKAEIRHELQVEEMRQLMQEQSLPEDFQQAVDEIAETVSERKSSLEPSPKAVSPESPNTVTHDSE